MGRVQYETELRHSLTRHCRMLTLPLIVALLPFVAPACFSGLHPLEAIEIQDPKLAERVWWDRFGTAEGDFSCYAPDLSKLSSGWRVLGHLGQPNHSELQGKLFAFRDCVTDGLPALANPTDFTKIWDDSTTTHIQDGSTWRILCPDGYTRLSDFFYPANDIEVPTGLINKVACVRNDLAETCGKGERVWKFELLLKAVSVWATVPTNSSLGGPFLYANKKVTQPPANIFFKCLRKSAFALI